MLGKLIGWGLFVMALYVLYAVVTPNHLFL